MSMESVDAVNCLFGSLSRDRVTTYGGGFQFRARVHYEFMGKSLVDDTGIHIERTAGITENCVHITETDALTAEALHLDFSPNYQDYKYDSGSGALVITQGAKSKPSPKMGPNYRVTIVPL